jgi:GntR family transcriptional regulator, galactonate operon transcriptional repressor
MDTFIGRGLHRSTVESLGLRIVSGEISEGETLDVAKLQRDFDVSLTVIREALRVLAAKGLVAARQKRGTYVRPRSEWQLLDGDVLRWQFGGAPTSRFFEDLSELRAMVEPTSARLAAQRRSEEDIATLQEHVDAMSAAAGNPDAEVAADLAFHQALLRATHNELLARLDGLIRNALEARDRVVHERPNLPDPVPNHRAVLRAVVKGDPDGAERAMRALLARSVEDIARLQSSRPTRPVDRPRRSASNG